MIRYELLIGYCFLISALEVLGKWHRSRLQCAALVLHRVTEFNLANVFFHTVGSRHIISPHPLLTRLVIRRRLFSPLVQAKSMASMGRTGLRCRKSMGRSRW